eukprot:8960216-Pyramimonas_sp.AAC.2
MVAAARGSGSIRYYRFCRRLLSGGRVKEDISRSTDFAFFHLSVGGRFRYFRYYRGLILQVCRASSLSGGVEEGRAEEVDPDKRLLLFREVDTTGIDTIVD